MAIDANKLVELAARDIPQTKIAKALGVTESAISQVLANERIVSAIADRKAEIAIVELDAITSIEAINAGLLGKIEDLIYGSDSLGEVVRAYETMSKLQDVKKATTSETVDGIKSIAQQVPQFIINNLNIQLNQRNEIISVDNRPMVTMPTIKVHRLLDARAKAEHTANGADYEAEHSSDYGGEVDF
jgi:predicted transcriptional regulator